MNAITELAQSMAELAQLPETIQAAIQKQHDKLNTQDARIQNVENLLGGMPTKEVVENKIVEVIKPAMAEFLESCKTQLQNNPCELRLDPNRPDESWDEIIEQGQKIQQPFWEEGEERWNRELGPSPKGDGWYGTVSMPVITIVVTDPEYKLPNTKTLPGRFALRSACRWGSAIRCDGTGDRVLKDTIRYGHCYNEPIGIYVEPSTELPSGMIVRPFEQGIKGCVIVGTNDVLPVYLASNPDRCHITGNKIMQHLGGFFGVKHGPAYTADWMPKPARPNDPTWLTETRICRNQFEGPHRFTHKTGERKKAGVFFTGQYCHVQDNSFFGWDQCIYSHGGGGRVITGNTAAHGATGDDRSWGRKDQMVMATICQDNKASDSVGMNAGGFMQVTPAKGSRVAATGGWHIQGENYL